MLQSRLIQELIKLDWNESMAEAAKNGRKALLRLIGKLLASVLSLLGVLSGCNTMMSPSPDYGVLGVLAMGQIHSAVDSNTIAGIQVKLSSPDSIVNYAADTSSSGGDYYLRMGMEYYPWPDSVRLTASDIDGSVNGSFQWKDTLLFLESGQEYQEILIDFYLQSDDE